MASPSPKSAIPQRRKTWQLNLLLLINMKICGGNIFVIFAGTIIKCKNNIVSKICTTPFMCYCMISLLATQCSKCTDNCVCTLATATQLCLHAPLPHSAASTDNHVFSRCCHNAISSRHSSIVSAAMKHGHYHFSSLTKWNMHCMKISMQICHLYMHVLYLSI